jgi:sn-glycerol 3-phosphate transport system substrate-binding protein
MKAAKYNSAPLVPRALAYYRVNGVQWAMPFAESNPILYYNKKAFSAAGLNPNQPPTTLSQMVQDAKTLKAHGSGMGLVLDSWHLETWLATANQLFVNHKNGRAGRATAGVFNNSVGRQIFTQLDDMVHSGAATTNPASGPDAFDNLLGIGTGKFGMTIDTSAALGTVTQLLGSGQYPNVQLGVGAFPVYSSSVRGGIEPGGSGVYISNKVPKLQQAAAWKYISFLMSASSQATWGAGTGYIPVNTGATQTATIQHLWATNPGFKVAYDQLTGGANTPATAGSIIGPYSNVRNDVLAAETSMYQQGVKPATALANAEKAVNADIANYNQRLGAS